MPRVAKPKLSFAERHAARFADPSRQYDPAKEGFGDPDEWRDAFRERMGFDEAKSVLGDENPLTVLGLAASATWAEVKAAFRKLAREWHPDKHGNSKESTEKMQKLNAAMSVLEVQYKP